MAGWKASMSERSSSPGLGALSPRSDSSDDINVRVKLMCSYGGRILPRPTDKQLRYMGGESRIVAVDRSVTLPELFQKLRKLAGPSMLSVKYQLPGEELDALVSVKSEEDLQNMMDEYDRSLMLRGPGVRGRLRVFLFPDRPQHLQQHLQQQQNQHGVADFTYRPSDQEFIDALNGSAAVPAERRVSSRRAGFLIWRTRQLSCKRLPPSYNQVARPCPRSSPKGSPPILPDDPWGMNISP